MVFFMVDLYSLCGRILPCTLYALTLYILVLFQHPVSQFTRNQTQSFHLEDDKLSLLNHSCSITQKGPKNEMLVRLKDEDSFLFHSHRFNDSPVSDA